MKVAIIGAMEEEVELIKNSLTELTVEEYNKYKFYIGKYLNLEVIVVVSKIGKVAAGMLCGTLFSNFKNIDKVINVGVSGGVLGVVEPGEVVVSEKLCYSDADVRAFNYKYGQMAGLPLYYESDSEMLNLVKSECYKGLILTGDTFETDKEKADFIIENYFNEENVLCFDMESTAFAQCCYMASIPFVAIRAISDTIGFEENQTKQHEDSLGMACEKANKILVEVLEGLSKK